MKTNEDRMIDFVAKSYEENRFDPKKALARSQNGSLRRSLSLSKRTVMLKRIAGVAAAAAVGIFLYLSWLTSWTGYAAYDIAQTFTLPDSSSVTLAPGSTLRLQKHKDKRLVQMTGKVYFNVRHDDRAPFRVDAGSGFVKVLGTRFQVDSRDPISVSVVSGKVLFSAIRSGEEALILTKGQSAVLDPAASKPVEITPKHPNPAAWATGEFIYDNTPLPEVLSELSEYYDVTLVAFDAGHSSGESRRLSGEFSTSSLQEILNLINSALGTDIQIESQPTR
uniref:FecR family protein n=1 Tax=Candidatus Cryptobacteroides bacterium TaxID=3085639 RepID=UPI00402A4FD2